MNQIVLIVLALGAGYFLLRMFLNSRPALSPQEAQSAVASGTAVLVDVREPAEWREGVADPAALLPLSDLRGLRKSWKPFLDKNGGKQLLLYCHSGTRSGMAAAVLKSEGYAAVNVGTFSGWASSGLPVRRP